MNIGFSFFGKLHGATVKDNVEHFKDFRHCWPSLKEKLITPFVEQGHTAKIYISSYEIEDPIISREFYDMVNPDDVYYSEEKDSNPFTCKLAAFDNFKDETNLDFIIFTRLDIHFNRILANENINFDKFNFLFPEGRADNRWWTLLRLVSDMVYMWPHHMTPLIAKAMSEMSNWPMKNQYHTHGFWLKLIQYLPESELHFISQYPEPSDVNSFHTTCRKNLTPEPMINDEVWKRYYADLGVNYRQY